MFCFIWAILITATICNFTIADQVIDAEIAGKFKHMPERREELRLVFDDYYKQTQSRVLKPIGTGWHFLLAVPTGSVTPQNIRVLASEDNGTQFSTGLTFNTKTLDGLTLTLKTHFAGWKPDDYSYVHDFLVMHFRDTYYKDIPEVVRQQIAKLCKYSVTFNATDEREGKPDESIEGDYMAILISLSAD